MNTERHPLDMVSAALGVATLALAAALTVAPASPAVLVVVVAVAASVVGLSLIARGLQTPHHQDGSTAASEAPTGTDR